MGEGDLKGMFQVPGYVEKKDKHDQEHGDHHLLNMEDDGDDDDVTTTSESSLGEHSRTSQGSVTSSSDFVDDASSSTSNSSSTNCLNGPLYELSELMAQLPIKRGLSKYFHGKSESFTSLSSVKSIEELAKKESPYRKKMKACKSYGGGLDSHKLYTLPRATISKKFSRNSVILIFSRQEFR
ncbi:uncharacterized protein LOC111278958 [Durio zibethinus]|uniref:Uncharacterized protein LOC111278958 n=1 Tax=Durio zibethinus TaxID=66656 RepID=A0A6P5X0Z9_DURZI|nr:uncharacterized protein LOC111278958 [Durio zibethinus]XP_022721477.1 uncharacterized protein LOC111278958 [Durio zibethinus]